MGDAGEACGTRTDCAIEARGVIKVFGGGRDAFRALDGVSLRVRPNEFFTLLGPSGCGKTTLLRLIAGFEYPSEGSILLDGEDIGALPPYRRPINTVFQNYALFPHMSVARNVGFGLEMQGRPRREIERRVGEVLELVRMGDLAGRSTAEISGGQQQRVALARALAPSPRVLLLDEPLSALDYKLRKGMQIELKRMQLESGITFVFVTHDQEEALSMSDRLAVMSAGRVLQVGTPRAIYERPMQRFVADFIGESNLLEGVVEAVTDDAATLRLASGTTIAAGRDVGEGGATPRIGERRGVLVRPEHVDLVAGPRAGRHGAHGEAGEDPAATVLEATLEHVVYSGTDTQRHVRLADGTPFVLRAQNRPSTDAARDAPGTAVRVRIPARSARLLED